MIEDFVKFKGKVVSKLHAFKKSPHKREYLSHFFTISLCSMILWGTLHLVNNLLRIMLIAMEVPDHEFTNKYLFSLMLIATLGYFVTKTMLGIACGGIERSCEAIKKLKTQEKKGRNKKSRM